MQQLLQNLASSIPAYLEDLLRLVTGPKRFVDERLSSADQPLQSALIFLAVSALLAWVVQTPRVEGDLIQDLGANGVFVLLEVLGYGGALLAAWRTVGAGAPTMDFFVIHCYFSGIIKLLMTATFLSSTGLLRATDPTLLADLMSATSAGDFPRFGVENTGRLLGNPGVWLAYAGCCAMIAWILLGWGAYRKLNSLSNLRSAIAFTLFMLFCVPIAALSFLIANSVVG